MTAKTKKKGRASPLSKNTLNAMIEEATMDACDLSEEASGFFAMLQEHLSVPFETTVLGLPVTVKSIQLNAGGQIVALEPALAAWRTMADALGAPLVMRTGFDPAACPLVVAQRPQPADSGWSTLTAAVAEHATGLVFVLEHLPEPAATGADVIGVLADAAGRRSRQANVPHALSEAQHPAGRLANRRLVRQ